ncbi:Glycosyltransferase, GT2 family [Ferrithrix thermotolerans DSM 19514]|uniref:Glycosyltransferase, GT2 family n=1 Tax=Ferrithrix thermotolerans DSM 19514 TaxID=1121881 RepID=A0A1M4V5F6_9ACTN|nr:glycosyltransferase [Ferrithrix thermotolerans]SHE64137.1 Glycosyltransferase, GT2 family [Ferrithrix thermotolerans DSM 19514]
MSQAPRVSAVVVACDPGDYLKECLVSLRDCGYPNLEIIVVDNSSVTSVAEMVEEIVPGAHLIRIEKRVGYSEAANRGALAASESAYILMMHDDAALLPDAIPAMLEVAFAKNAAVVTPKIMVWDSPSQILQIGANVDRTGSLAPRIDVGDLDQGQYDSIDEVAIAPGGVQLIRTDLFQSLGGFDEELQLFGEDVDFCVRAAQVGAKVYCAPRAKARHLVVSTFFRPHRSFTSRFREEEGLHRVGSGHLRRMLNTRRAQLRIILKSTSGLSQVRSVLTYLAVSVVETLFYLLTGRVRLAVVPFDAVGWNISRLGQISDERKKLRRLRGQVRPAEIDYIAVSSRFRAFLVARRSIKKMVGEGKIPRVDLVEYGVDEEERLSVLSEKTSGSRIAVDRASSVILVLGVLAVLLPSIPVIFGHPPLIGSMAPFPPPATLISSFFSGRYDSVVVAPSVAPTADLILGALGFVFFGAMGVLHQFLLVVAEMAGLFGMYALASKVATRSASKIVTGIYGVLPLLAQLVHQGSYFGILAFGAVPTLLALHARAADSVRLSRRMMRRLILETALFSSLVAAIVPVVFLGYVLTVAVFLAVSYITGDRGRARRSGFVLLIVSSLTLVLNLPWSMSFFYMPVGVSRLFGPSFVSSISYLSVLSFNLGQGYSVPSLYVLVLIFVVAGLAFSKAAKQAQIGRRTTVALTVTFIGFAAVRGLFGTTPIPLWTLTLFAASFLMTAMAVTIDALADDLPKFNFGLRHFLAGFASIALVVAVLAGVFQVARPRFDMPTTGFDGASSFMSGLPKGQSVLWLGSPEILPVGGWKIADGLSAALVSSSSPSFTALYPPPNFGQAEKVISALRSALVGHGVLLGHVLEASGVRYVVLPQPNSQIGSFEGTPLDMVLGRQIDMKQLLIDPTVVMYEVTGTPVSYAAKESFVIDMLRLVGIGIEFLVLALILYGLLRRKSWVMTLTFEEFLRRLKLGRFSTSGAALGGEESAAQGVSNESPTVLAASRARKGEVAPSEKDASKINGGGSGGSSDKA